MFNRRPSSLLACCAAALIAVVAAGDDLSSLLAGFGMDGAGCSYTCADGTRVHSNKEGYEPSFNGCGTAEFPMQAEGEKYHLAHCCNAHDICYSDCGSSYEECESDFQSCMKAACLDNYDDVESGEGKKCASTGALFSAATRMGGCTYFKESQAAACDCTEHGGAGYARPTPRPKRRRRTKRRGKGKARARGEPMEL